MPRKTIAVFLICMLALLAACREEEAAPTATELPAATALPAATDTPVPPAETALPPTETPVPATETPAAAAYEPRFEAAACAFEEPDGADVSCGYLVVPEDRANVANGREVRLHVAVFASDNNDPAPDPIVYLEGGPGGEALESIPFTFDQFAPFLESHDFIMFDQRGTGYSEPSLACPEQVELSLELLDDILSDQAYQDRFLETMGECRDRLVTEGVDLAAYDSAANAADVADLRQALGYDEWNLYGISYGTRLALTVMRDHPEGVRSVILDSAYPLEASLPLESPRNFARALDVFFAGCAADSACNEAYPDLENTFFQLVAALDESPITVPVYDFLRNESYDAALQGDDLIGVVFQGLYSEEIFPSLPQLLYETRDGDYSLLSTLLSNKILNQEFLSIGMYFSVQCQDELAFSSPDELEARIERYPRLEAYYVEDATAGDSVYALCDLWDVGTSDSIENEPVSSDIPTLILAGEYDPITPPAWGSSVADTLANSTYLEFPGVGHGVSLAGDCPVQITQEFLADPSTPPDTGCIASMEPPAFAVRGQAAEIVLEPFTSDSGGVAFSGLVPEGWDEVGPGTFARRESGLDNTLILQQALPGAAGSTDLFLELLAGQLGLDGELEASRTETIGGKTWTFYESALQGMLVDIAVAEDDGALYLVVLFSTLGERPQLYDEVFLPALEAITVQ